MKKLFVLLLLVAVSTQSYAQLAIASNGYVSFQSSQTPLSPISINSAGNSYDYMVYRGNKNATSTVTYGGVDAYNWGYVATFANAPKMQTANFFIGVKSQAKPYYNQSVAYGRSYGIMGLAGDFSSGYNYAIFGRLEGSNNGAAIYGTSSASDNGDNVNGKYAGYFNGNVKVTGTLTVPASNNMLLLQQAVGGDNSAVSAINNVRNEETVTSRLSSLKAISYHKIIPTQVRVVAPTDTITDEPHKNIYEQQILDKKHYGLDIEQLEVAFPELVYETEDGNRAINYVELIPLLVETINELNTRLSHVENNDAMLSRESSKTTGVTSVVLPAAVLYQNTPNPFTERTTIRFSLPENAGNAHIYVFDMTGKMQKQIPVDASMQSVTINGYELQAGMYFYSLVVNGKEMDTKRMILSK